MKKLVWVLAGALTIIFTPVISVRAESSKRGLLIDEIQTGSGISASEEFIELYNQSEDTLNLSLYKLEYFSASSQDFTSPSRTINLSGTLYPGGRYLASTTNYLSAQSNIQFSATMAKTGGHVRLVSTVDSLSVVHDLVGWGSATLPETLPIMAPDGGESLQRKITPDGTYQDLDDNSQDFSISLTPTPESNNPQPPVIEDPVPLDPEPTPPIDEQSEPTPIDPEPDDPQPLLLPIQITELLPNPGSPLTDADDEFIELFNPNNDSINLENYRLETGNDFGYHYTFGSQEIGPQQYLVIKSKDTNLVLSNSGGKARLINSGGAVISETALYDDADDNMSWAFIDSTWQWTTTPTPSQTNILTTILPFINTSSPKPKKAATATKPKPKKATSAKVASAKTTKPKSSTSKPKKSASDKMATGTKPGVASALHPGILAAIGLLALGYAAYEYRSDIANRFHQLREHRRNRPSNGPTP